MTTLAAATMDNGEPESILMSVPLEIRHLIFEWASVRDYKPKNLLQKWFERKEIKQIKAQRAADKASNNGGDGDGDQDAEDEDGEMDEAEDMEEHDESAEDDDQDSEDPSDEDDEEEQDREDSDGDGIDGDGNTVTDVTTTANTTGGATTVTATARRRRPAIQTSPKWRHIPNLMSLSQTPPPLNLLLTSKQLYKEAIHWFYETAVLHIDATAGFAHTTFFEESLEDLADATFSPVEKVRRAEITFVWDTDWLRKSDAIEDIFQAMLNQRAIVVCGVLGRAPELKHVIVKWHDSNDDPITAFVKNELLDGFLTLPANITLQEKYLDEGEVPDAESTMGKRRLEFEDIVDANHNFM